MATNVGGDLDKVVTNIRDQLEILNPNKKFSKTGVILFALQDSPNLRNIINTSGDQRVFRKVPKKIRTH